MRSNRIRNRFEQAQPTIQAAFAFADVVVEATRRSLCRGVDPASFKAPPERASGEIFVILGRNLQLRTRRMLAADDRYQELKARQGRRRSRRDEIARRGHALVVEIRKYLQGFYGWDGACEVLGLFGATEREPRALHRQLGEAVWWARNWDGRPEPLVAGGEEEAEKCLVKLEALDEELDRAVGEVGRGAREVEVAMLDQRAAMAEFDHAYKHGAGAIEAQLIQVGLPTLAAAVRPGVGRRGRPLRKRPVDLHPDLVEQVRAGGLIDLDEASSTDAGDGSTRDVASPEAAGHGIEADLTASAGARKGSGRNEKSEQPLLERSADEEIIEHPAHEGVEAGEKSRHPVHEQSDSEEIIEPRVHERRGGEEIIEQHLHKSTASEASRLFSRLNVPLAAARCGQDPRRRDLRRRPGGPAAGRSPIEKAGRETSSWWQRLLRVA